MPSRKEIQWAQLKVGTLILVSTVILIGLIFLMTGATGGLFAHQIVFRCYFPNASGLKVGAPVTLEGVTIGNVVKMRVVPDRNPNPVEVVMRVGEGYRSDLHTDSTATITTAGVLGDSFVDIDSTHATGPEPRNDAELQPSGAPTIQSVINTSQVSIEEINHLIHKMQVLIDTLNTSRGTVGELINDPNLKKNIVSIATNLQTVTQAMTQDKGTIGKLVNDDELYKKVDTAVDNLNALTGDLNAGKGSIGKLLHDDTFYNNLNSSVDNLNKVLASVNAGKGAFGELVKDPTTAQKLKDTIANLDDLLKGINAGKGSIGQLAQNRTLYDHLDQTADQAQQLIKGMRENPKKYLVIQLKLF